MVQPGILNLALPPTPSSTELVLPPASLQPNGFLGAPHSESLNEDLLWLLYSTFSHSRRGSGLLVCNLIGKSEKKQKKKKKETQIESQEVK